MATIKSKPTYIINPKTKRPIEVGGQVYKRLVKAGIIEIITEEENKMTCPTRPTESLIDKLNRMIDAEDVPQPLPLTRQTGYYKQEAIKGDFETDEEISDDE